MAEPTAPGFETPQRRPAAAWSKSASDGPGAIVVGVDGSETSMRAVALALGVARRQRAQLIGVYARCPGAALAMAAASSGSGALAARAAQSELEQDLEASFVATAQEYGVPATMLVRDGDPLHVLLEVSRDLEADAIIVGASAKARHRFAGSLAVRLVKRACCPVTVVP